ncbi:spore coat protein [Halobacillus halophilus]|uniref:Spore coat protein X n=1 Tax=Halobacillus halophilus (strain ATCC 35676 / DSM 2266 / JCM 20832 / KCTC 3685 / LMG 17431 / NBRC 102448 / NCIMB 2269) TaxID=866895 RepID=I0JI90_HALH3|nr:spore coat protein [Halobacillus halophilus]ASF38051.1 spore coat protein [Halobacillus halophilus]CCG43858.1 spore coat protein X [Halobacillus halophilus DSM 2266]
MNKKYSYDHNYYHGDHHPGNYYHGKNEKDCRSDHDAAIVLEDGTQVSLNDQESDELIWIRNSCNVSVHTTDTQAAISLQAGLQLAIALVISITIGDSDKGKAIAQEIVQKFDSEQTNYQKIFVDNSKDVDITTTDTDLTVNIQALLQVLVTLVAELDVF